MVPDSQTPGDVPAARSGGKILKSRKTVARRTPYDRPIQPQPPLPQPENPNWLSGLVSPAKYVAGGATKILSSIWNPKTWVTPSSSSEDTDSDSGDEDDFGDDENDSHGQQQDNSYQKNETLHLIEQLLMLEQFSREEGNRLIEIINSRVVDYSTREGVDAGPSTIRSSANNETSDIRNQTILEAKRWVEENKVRSALKSNLDNGTYALKSVTTPQATESEAGSPVDVAKSYMKARPPWASPLNLEKSLTPSPLFKEKMPYSSVGGTSFSSAKRDYLSAGTWNIQEELRRVRTKATEDMLNSHRSIKYASSNLQDDAPIHSLANDKSTSVVGTPKSGEETVNLAADETPLSLSDVRTAQDVLPTETLPSNPIMPVLEQYEGINSDKRQTTGPSSEGNKLETEEDHRQPDENGSMAYDVDRADKNGYPLTESPNIPVINNSQCSSNTNEDMATKIDGTTENRAVTRSSRRGKGRGK
ncbi:protein KAKU4 [Rutidosis leptorrhynchoides]|uniref:protein KAKU4 n=1 Tax=Rutidosis leptorrhynchoides TaxID=125765 RepID=UPI003A9A06D0